MNPHSQPIVDNFDDECEVKTLVPQTPPAKFMLSKERLKIFHQQMQASHGTHHAHWIVHDDHKPEIHGNNLPDSHMILVTGNPRQDGGILSFDGVDVNQNQIITKRDGVWGIFECERVEEPDDEDEEDLPAEEQIYRMFLERCNGDHESAWDMYHRFRAHQEQTAREDRIYQAILEELGGNEALAEDVHALWCEQEEEQAEDPQQERGDENEQEVVARATMWAKAVKMGYELRGSSLQKSPEQTSSAAVQDDNNHPIESPQQSNVRGSLSDRAMRLDAEQEKRDDDSLDENQRKTTPNNTSDRNNRLIDIDEGQDVYSCLDEWAKSLETGIQDEHASVVDQTAYPVDDKDATKLIDIGMKTPDVYECLGLWAQQFEEIPNGNSPAKERLPAAIKTTATSTTNCADIFNDGKATKATKATTPSVQPPVARLSPSGSVVRTPNQGIRPMRLQTPEDFLNYHRRSRS